MKSSIPISALAAFSLLLLACPTSSPAQDHKSLHFAGVLNDYSPGNVKGGPWEMHGQWSMDLDERRGTADFYADMTMSDYAAPGGIVDPTQAGQNAHTHHIRLTGRTVTPNMNGCPTFSPATTEGFQISGTVSLITGNGGTAPFETSPISSTLQVCVTGAGLVTYSNMTMVFGGPATSHFGSQAVHGVVRKVTTVSGDNDDRRDNDDKDDRHHH